MATSYAYKVRTKEGRLVEGKMEADAEGVVASKLRAQGLVPVHIKKEAKVSAKTEIHILPQRVKLKDLAVFSRQFATMINSGLPLLRALSILAEQTESDLLKKTLGEVRDDVERGASLSAATSKHHKVFNKLFVAMVRAGETGGQLDTVLLRVADGFETDYKLRQKIKSAMTYPVMVFAMSMLMVAVMLTFIVPTFASMFEDLGGELPLPTQILMTLSQHMKILAPLFIAGAIAGTIAYKKIRASNAAARLRIDALKLKIPVFGELFKKVALSRFSRTLALLLHSGVPVLQALDIVAETTGNEVLSRAALAVKESVRGGETVAGPLEEHKIFPPMVVQMISVGEDTGALDAMLDKIGDFYDQEVESMMESLTSLIEPLMIAFLGALVGSMVVALYLPMFKIYDLIK